MCIIQNANKIVLRYNPCFLSAYSVLNCSAADSIFQTFTNHVYEQTRQRRPYNVNGQRLAVSLAFTKPRGKVAQHILDFSASGCKFIFLEPIAGIQFLLQICPQ